MIKVRTLLVSAFLAAFVTVLHGQESAISAPSSVDVQPDTLWTFELTAIEWSEDDGRNWYRFPLEYPGFDAEVCPVLMASIRFIDQDFIQVVYDDRNTVDGVYWKVDVQYVVSRSNRGNYTRESRLPVLVVSFIDRNHNTTRISIDYWDRDRGQLIGEVYRIPQPEYSRNRGFVRPVYRVNFGDTSFPFEPDQLKLPWMD